MEKRIVYGFIKNGLETTLTHATINLETTLCGRVIPPEWYADDWTDGPECKRCQKQYVNSAE